MGIKWIIILVLYFHGSEKIQINETTYYFENGVQCAKFKAEPEFKQLLIETFKDKGIAYVRPICKPVHLEPNKIREDYIADND